MKIRSGPVAREGRLSHKRVWDRIQGPAPLQHEGETIEPFGDYTIMKIQTSRFGALDVSDDMLLTFSAGLVGFPAFRRYVVLDPPENVDYQWFQSVDEPSLAFVIMDAHLLHPDFRTNLSEEGLAELEVTPTDSISIMAVVTIPSDQPDQATANLRAPLVVNERTKQGKQLILHESIPLRYPLFQDPTEYQPHSEIATAAASV